MTNDEISMLAAAYTDEGGIIELHREGAIEFARAIEARARAETIEECAKVCDELQKALHAQWFLAEAGACFKCAAAIRALTPDNPPPRN